ncbi:MAG: tRNA pseudouridine(55) synthase TruB, partial [Nevskiales bacterium]
MGRGRRARGRNISGILLLDKPIGRSSNAALQEVKRLFDARKAGHTGSLDPLATGLLPICFGHATKLSGYLLDADKAYWVKARLGERTDTADAEGEVIERLPVPDLSSRSVLDVLGSFLGEQEQLPPMYSALKHEGKRLYELARAGEEVERKKRRINIYDLQLLSAQADELVMSVRCSKGTYIRTLVEDIAQALGTVGHVAALRHTAVGAFTGEQMIDLPNLHALAEAGVDALDG